MMGYIQQDVNLWAGPSIASRLKIQQRNVCMTSSLCGFGKGKGGESGKEALGEI